MKIKLPVAGCKLQVPWRNRATGDGRNLQPSTFNHARSGIALVITLIMLSVTLVMALAFLAVSHRERDAVSTTTDTATARLAADSALAAAQAQIAANILASSNAAAYSYGLLVSTNYINSVGFITGPNDGNLTNVSYNYPNGAPVTGNDLVQNIANLLFLPRAPVFIKTNQTPYGNDFRYYLDLNQNGRDEGNGLQPQFGNALNSYLHTDGSGENNKLANVLTNEMTGDPDWIGVLEHPDQPHGPNNHFIARYAFAAVPVGNTLDLNAIYNQTATRTVNPAAGGNDGFMRNQGVGSWELNLAAFLTDLNTNEWEPITAPYRYLETNGFSNTGVSFDDARALLSWRYGGNYGFLASANNVFANTLNYPFNIDLYSDRPLQTTVNTNADFPGDTLSFSWAGADNTNKFFSLPSDLFDPAKSSGGVGSFTYRLTNAAAGNSSYDRYTFYRMLDELGTDTTPERGKLNLNYNNLDPYVYTSGGNTYTNPPSATNLMAWTPLGFFTNAADAMLRRYTANWYASDPTNFFITCYGFTPQNYVAPNGFGVTNLAALGMTNEVPAFGITNIPVFVNGRFRYTPAINRVLQLAANMYDASTNSFYPSVFRPVFTNDAGNVFICGYQQVTSLPNNSSPTGYGVLPINELPFSQAIDISALSLKTSGVYSNNVFGVPWIIGAKKYLPGLNQFSLVNSAQVTRKLEVVRNHIGPGADIWTNQMNIVSINNNLGVSFWNSYANDYPTNYPGSLNMSVYVSSTIRLVLTNSDWAPSTDPNYLFSTNYTFIPSRWPGSKWTANDGGEPAANSFISVTWTNNLISDMVYKLAAKRFAFTNEPDLWENSNPNHTLYPLPQFGLLTTNWVQAFIVDNGHVIDYVQLRGPISNANLNSGLNDPGPGGEPNNFLWVTNAFGTGSPTSWGIVDQLVISSQPADPPPFARWNKHPYSIPGLSDQQAAARVFFASILSPNSVYQYRMDNKQTAFYTNYELAVQAPYTASRMVYAPYLYQVNDPLVHYTVNDLDAGKAGVWAGNNVHANGVLGHLDDASTDPFPMPPTTEIVKGRYQPWSKMAPTAFQSSAYNFTDPYNLAYKDPLVWGSDYWDFPTNKYPAVGWIGRVHRGTPWQTVYLKAHNVLHELGAGVNPDQTSGTNTWAAWTGDYNNFDAANSGPLQDRMLFDLFTAAPNENASRGQLSVNQTHLAAWSAVFSGMVALTNVANMPPFATTVVTPASNSWVVIQPAGVGGIYSQLGSVVTNINYMRAGFTNLDGVVGTFEHKGDILSVAALTEQSPFLNWNNVNQQRFGISDAAYEWLPQQAMSLLTCPAGPRYVVYCYGQTLKPAQDGLVTSSAPLAGPGNPTSFGLVTNYQVVAESASRAVIRLDRHVTATGTNYTTTVESYNPLPPN